MLGADDGDRKRCGTYDIRENRKAVVLEVQVT
jgi:hypothetical protein